MHALTCCKANFSFSETKIRKAQTSALPALLRLNKSLAPSYELTAIGAFFNCMLLTNAWLCSFWKHSQAYSLKAHTDNSFLCWLAKHENNNMLKVYSFLCRVHFTDILERKKQSFEHKSRMQLQRCRCLCLLMESNHPPACKTICQLESSLFGLYTNSSLCSRRHAEGH